MEVVRAKLWHFTHFKLILILWMHVLTIMEQQKIKMMLSMRHQDVLLGTASSQGVHWLHQISWELWSWKYFCVRIWEKKILSKMDPEQGSRKGSNSILLPAIISKFDSFSTEILPKMETSNSGLEKLFVWD